ncbi:MAG: hypothetical protein KF773_05470 [Deltaproteobacteria bacterium]|nr:hypothetical protein [Deltaproteobacteria bacterium]MCW5800947.1 hypothetical protein [Deltaproteobacteria bacterium]
MMAALDDLVADHARRGEPFIGVDRLVRACALRIVPEVAHRAWFSLRPDVPPHTTRLTRRPLM